MGESSLTQRWREELFRVLEEPEWGAPLREAALAAVLGDWTRHMTHATVATCNRMGWRAAAKGFVLRVLPVPRNEYLGLDVIAFPPSSTRWPMPVAVFELENSRHDDRVGYSLWKVLCVRTALRVVFAYRRSADEGVDLVTHLTESIIGGVPLAERLAITGETVLIIGNRGVAETFPYGYFRAWTLDTNTGSFERV
jgi:hypothetical protein